MQIQDYLYAIRRRLWLPIAVPLAAAVITAGVLYIQPERFEAQATVIVPALSGQGYSTSAVTQYVSTYKDVLISEPVVKYVSTRTGEKEKDLVAGLSADTPTASSNIITVTYVGPNKKTVATSVQIAAMQALDVLLGPQKALADQEVATALAGVNDANRAIVDYTSQTGYPDPNSTQKNLVDEISQLTVQLQQANFSGDKARVNALTVVIGKYNQKLVDIAPIVVHYNELTQRLNSANAVYNKALEDQNRVDAELISNHDASAVSAKFLGHISRVPDMLKFGTIALALGLVLTIGFVVFVEFYRPAVARVPYLRWFAVPAPSESDKVVAVSNGNGHSNGKGGLATPEKARSSSRR